MARRLVERDVVGATLARAWWSEARPTGGVGSGPAGACGSTVARGDRG